MKKCRSGLGFYAYLILDTIIALLVAFGPSILIWEFLLRPDGFLARVVATIICGVVCIPMGIAAFFLWAYIVSETTGL